MRAADRELMRELATHGKSVTDRQTKAMLDRVAKRLRELSKSQHVTVINTTPPITLQSSVPKLPPALATVPAVVETLSPPQRAMQILSRAASRDGIGDTHAGR